MHGITPLLSAIWEGHKSCVEYLLSAVSQRHLRLEVWSFSICLIALPSSIQTPFSCLPTHTLSLHRLGRRQKGHGTRWKILQRLRRVGGHQGPAQVDTEGKRRSFCRQKLIETSPYMFGALSALKQQCNCACLFSHFAPSKGHKAKHERKSGLTEKPTGALSSQNMNLFLQ